MSSARARKRSVYLRHESLITHDASWPAAMQRSRSQSSVLRYPQHVVASLQPSSHRGEQRFELFTMRQAKLAAQALALGLDGFGAHPQQCLNVP
jgi:hypothetical protein